MARDTGNMGDLPRDLFEWGPPGSGTVRRLIAAKQVTVKSSIYADLYNYDNSYISAYLGGYAEPLTVFQNKVSDMEIDYLSLIVMPFSSAENTTSPLSIYMNAVNGNSLNTVLEGALQASPFLLSGDEGSCSTVEWLVNGRSVVNVPRTKIPFTLTRDEIRIPANGLEVIGSQELTININNVYSPYEDIRFYAAIVGRLHVK